MRACAKGGKCRLKGKICRVYSASCQIEGFLLILLIKLTACARECDSIFKVFIGMQPFAGR